MKISKTLGKLRRKIRMNFKMMGWRALLGFRIRKWKNYGNRAPRFGRTQIRYRKMKNVLSGSFSPFYYIYMSEYKIDDKYAFVLAALVAAVSVIMGLFQKNIVMDTVVYVLSFGSFLCNYAIIRVLYKAHRRNCFRESTGWVLETKYDAKWAREIRSWKGYKEYIQNQAKAGKMSEEALKKYEDTMNKFSGDWFNSLNNLDLYPMIILSYFFEIYTHFLLAFIMPDLPTKIAAGFLFTWLIIFYKTVYNFTECRLSTIIRHNASLQWIAIAAGSLLSLQTKIDVTVFYDERIILFMVIIGMLRYLVSKNFRAFFAEQRRTIKNRAPQIDFYMLRYQFGVHLTKLGEPTPAERWVKQWEREKRAKEAEDRRKVEEQNRRRYEENMRRYEEEKKELERLEKLVVKHEGLTDEKEVRERALEIAGQMENDRASIKR